MMRYRAVLMFCVLLACPSWPSAAEIVVFGDSLSDTGNVFAASKNDPSLKPDPPSPPYFQGRMSNGPVWVEHLADMLGVERPAASLNGGLNFAYAGATTEFGTRLRSSVAVPGQVQAVDPIGRQIENFLAVRQRFAPDQLVVLWAGADDLLDATLAGPAGGAGIVTGAIANLHQHLWTLDAHGAERVLVPNQIDASDAPYWKGFGPQVPEGSRELVASLTAAFNAELETMLDALVADPAFSAELLRPDMFGPVKAIFENPEESGFTNVDEPVFLPGVGVISDASGHLFWDTIHPTTAGHRAIAEIAVKVVPVPAALPLFATGLIALAVVKRRCR
jgi:phospholipase/lecithinase/hemolysin